MLTRRLGVQNLVSTCSLPAGRSHRGVLPAPGSFRYFALASDFSPTQFGLKSFMSPLVAQVFRGAGNDLVVPADSVWRGPESGPFPLHPAAVELFGAGDGVGHSGYFGNPRAVRRLLEWLG